MTAEELRGKRVLARIPGHIVSLRAGIGRGRLSEIERNHVSAPMEELCRIDKALDELIAARQKVARFASECGWPMLAP